LSFLLGGLVFVGGFLVAGLLGGDGFLALLDFSDGFFGEGLLVFGAGVFHFFNIVEGDSLNGSFFSEDFLLFVFADVGEFEFLVETSPGGRPAESLGFKFS